MALRARTVIGLGELLWDCDEGGRKPGGAPANVAFHAAQLGMDGVVCSRVGDDDAGHELIRYVESRGIGADSIQVDTHHATGSVSVSVSSTGSPSYVIHQDVAWDYMEFDAGWQELHASAGVVCFGTLAQRSPQSRTTIRRCLDVARDATLIYDVNLRSPFFSAALLADSLRRAHVVKLSDEEVPVVAGLCGIGPCDDLSSFAAEIRSRYDVQIVCVTRGAHGCLASSEDDIVDVSGKQVRVVDTVGAGDAFTAAVAYGLTQAWPLRSIVEFANEVGALVAGRAGAMPDLHDEYAALRAIHDTNA